MVWFLHILKEKIEGESKREREREREREIVYFKEIFL
jgi:hypothetical protein